MHTCTCTGYSLASCLTSCLSRYSCPPRSFIPALCKIFLDEEAPDNVLEVTARALTYYLDVSVECSRRITTVDGALKAIIARMYAADMETRMSKDLVEQSVKVSSREIAKYVYTMYVEHWKKCT